MVSYAGDITPQESWTLLNDHPDAHHILLIDEFENRVKFMTEHYELTPRKARQMVQNEDKRRVNLYRKLHKEDFDNPSLYHMVLNMGRISLDDGLDMICRLAKVQ